MPPVRRLPRHVSFARSLALVSGAAIGITAGAALIAPAGCGNSCIGSPCGNYVPPPDTHRDSGLDAADAIGDAANGHDAGAGGGPLSAPPLPASWIA